VRGPSAGLVSVEVSQKRSKPGLSQTGEETRLLRVRITERTYAFTNLLHASAFPLFDFTQVRDQADRSVIVAGALRRDQRLDTSLRVGLPLRQRAQMPFTCGRLLARATLICRRCSAAPSARARSAPAVRTLALPAPVGLVLGSDASIRPIHPSLRGLHETGVLSSRVRRSPQSIVSGSSSAGPEMSEWTLPPLRPPGPGQGP
jgi:hypothetical protein